MRRIPSSLETVITLMLGAVMCGGCTTLEESYTGHDPGHVWNAAIAAAESPEYYPDWFMTENNVWVDESGQRIEVARTLKRDLVRPRAKPRREVRDLQLTIQLLHEENGPALQVVSRHVDVPAVAARDAKLFFDEVWDILGPAPARPAAPPPAEPVDDDDDDEPILIDIDDLDG